MSFVEIFDDANEIDSNVRRELATFEVSECLAKGRLASGR